MGLTSPCFSWQVPTYMVWIVHPDSLLFFTCTWYKVPMYLVLEVSGYRGQSLKESVLTESLGVRRQVAWWDKASHIQAGPCHPVDPRMTRSWSYLEPCALRYCGASGPRESASSFILFGLRRSECLVLIVRLDTWEYQLTKIRCPALIWDRLCYR